MRRRLRLASLIALFTLAFFPHGSAPAIASPRVSGKVVAKELTHPAPAHRDGTLDAVGGALIAGSDAGSTGPGALVYTSPVLAAGQLFDRIGAHWVAAPGTEDTMHVELRSSADAVTWSAWRAADADEDMADTDKNEWYSSPWPAVPGARYAQYRVWLDNGDPDAVRTIGITLMDVNDLNQSPVSRLMNDLMGALSDIARSGEAAASVGATKILTRQDWSADETMMKWSPQYQKQHTKAIIHHTVTDDGGTNVAATIRTIYYFHAVTRGWGDIGYNYLVDKFGNIWTGRQGGDHVIGGHAYGWNDGAFGVAAIGDYTTVAPTSALQYAIANVISLKFSQYGIVNAFGADYFVHKEQGSDGVWVDVAGYPPNIQGHRNANYIVGQNGGQTECPGNQTYNMMDGLKRITQSALDAGYTQLAQLAPALPRGTFPGASLLVPTSVTNRGRTTIPAGTAVSYQILQSGTLIQPQGGSATLAAALAPGAIAIVNVPFTGPAAGDGYLVRWDLQTGGAWWNTLYNTPIRDMALRSTDWSATWVSDTMPAVWSAGETKTVTATVLNDGGRPWPSGGTNPVKVSYKWTSTSTGNVIPGAQLATLPSDVAPGQTVTVVFPVTAPTYPTNYSIRLDLTKVGEFNFGDKGVAPDDTTTAVLLDARATYAPTAVAFSSGQTATVPITITNTGAGVFPTTSAQPVNLSYHWSTASGTSVLWDGVRTKLPTDLAPGASVQLQASVTAPPTGGTFTLRFDLVQEGVTWFSGKANPTGNLSVTVAGPVIKTYGASYQPQVAALAVSGAQTAVPITVSNSGNFTWPAGGATPVNLSYHWSDSAGNTVVWDGLRTKLSADVAAGASQSLQATVQVPTVAGTYTLRWDLVQEGVSWFSGQGVRTYDQPVTVQAQQQATTYGASYDLSAVPSGLPTEMRALVLVSLTNTSSFAWGAGVNLAYHWYDAAGNTAIWDGVRTPLSLAPGASGTVKASVVGPSTPGAYTLRFDVVREGVAWFSGQGVATQPKAVNVTVPNYGMVFSAAPTSVTLPANGSATVPLTVKNTGSLAWTASQLYDASYHITRWDDSVVVWDGARTPLPDIAPGQSATILVAVRAPAAGSYVVKFDLVREGVTWFSGQGIPTGNVAALVQ
ncbi:MAG: hypothetical protein NVS9B6_09680 [Candidatus Limnocylindrales bacterium]